jgi:hypothetical protein
VGSPATGQAALRHPPPATAAPAACSTRPDKHHGPPPRGTSCHAPAAAARAATLTGVGAQYLEARHTAGKWPFAAPHMLDTGVSPP